MKNLITTATIFILAFVLNMILAVTASAQDLERGDLNAAMTSAGFEKQMAEKQMAEKMEAEATATDDVIELALNK